MPDPLAAAAIRRDATHRVTRRVAIGALGDGHRVKAALAAPREITFGRHPKAVRRSVRKTKAASRSKECCMATLTSIEERLGRWNHASFAAAGESSRFTISWECGCFATGPSLEALEIASRACAAHVVLRPLVSEDFSLRSGARRKPVRRGQTPASRPLDRAG